MRWQEPLLLSNGIRDIHPRLYSRYTICILIPTRTLSFHYHSHPKTHKNHACKRRRLRSLDISLHLLGHRPNLALHVIYLASSPYKQSCTYIQSCSWYISTSHSFLRYFRVPFPRCGPLLQAFTRLFFICRFYHTTITRLFRVSGNPCHIYPYLRPTLARFM